MTSTRAGFKFGPFELEDTSSTSKIYYHDFRKNEGTVHQAQDGLLEKLLTLNNELGDAQPEILTISRSVESSDSRGKGGGSLTMIYRIGGDKSLLVNYSFAALDIGWLKATAADKAIQAFAPKEARKIVKLTRQYFKKKFSKDQESSQVTQQSELSENEEDGEDF
jgi:hypothetical protein